MVKEQSNTSIRSKKSRSSRQSVPKENKSSNLTTVVENDFPEVTISVQSYQNIVPSFPSSFIFLRCQYAGKELGESPKILMTDDPLTTANHEFTFRFDPYVSEELNNLAAHPVILKLFQVPNPDGPFYVEEGSAKMASIELSSIESALSLYEALTGDVVEKKKVKEVKTPKPSKKKGKKQSKGSDQQSKKSSKDSRKSKKSDASKGSVKKKSSSPAVEKKPKPVEPSEVETGACILDLLPLIFGKSNFTEFVPLVMAQPYCDERMTRWTARPGLLITVFVNKPFKFSCKPNMLTLTIDSIYNSPSIMEDMDYHLCFMLPFVNLAQQAIIIKNGIYKTGKNTKSFKQWPELPDDYMNITQYDYGPHDINNYYYNHSTNYDSIAVKNFVDTVDLEDSFTNDKPRIQFNCIYRDILLKEAFLALLDQIKKFQRVIVEIHAFKKKTAQTVKDPKGKKSKSAVTVQATEDTKPTSYLHLMAVVDLSSLLYPGVTKVRTAVPLTTFHEQEALILAGLEKSYFFPPQSKQAVKEENSSEPKGKRDKSASSKSSKKSKESKSSKKGKKKDKNLEPENLNMKEKLPPAPTPEPPPEPSIKVFCEDGTPTFIVVEFELTEPLVEKRKLEDLHGSLRKLVQMKSETPKVTLDSELMTELCRKKMKQLIKQINQEYNVYVEKKTQCHCENQADFLTYLQRIGVYHKLMLSTMDIASKIGQFKLNQFGCDKIQQQKLVQDIFILFTSEVKHILNKMLITNRVVTEVPKALDDRLRFYAQEATAVGNFVLAEKYYCERLHRDPDNPDFWFDYAVFKKQCGEEEKAFLCCHTALSKKMYHRNSLILTGILLAESKRLQEAEVCLLTVLVHEPRWIEAWMVLYFFYKETDNNNGMDLAMEMAQNYLEYPGFTPDYFLKSEDLEWQSSIVPNTLYFKVSVLLLKMRVYSWVENVLVHEIQNTGVVHYLLAVICFYRKKYHHGLKHLERARFFHGSDFAVVSLTGHCYMALGKFKKALQEYLHVLESYERPEDMQLLYLNCAQIIENQQEARKLLLLACKNHPTPYAWLCCGVVYLKLNDLLSAEECLSESVFLDNSISTAWGYLTLVNLRLKHVSEAEICYGVALKNNFNDEEIKRKIKMEFEKLKPRENSVFNGL